MIRYTAKVLYGTAFIYYRKDADSLQEAIDYFKDNLLPGEMLIRVKGWSTEDMEDSGDLNYQKEIHHAH